MSTTTSQKPSSPPAPPPTTTTTKSTSTDEAKILHNVALAGLIVCPAIIFLPPRRFNLQTIVLLSGTFASANHLTYEYTGRSFTQRWGARLNSLNTAGDLPPQAILVQERMKKEREARSRKAEGGNGIVAAPGIGAGAGEDDERDKKGVLQKAWYGQEGKDWKQKRDQREKEALEEGKGFSGLIADQIWDVWSWGGKKDDKSKDEDPEEKKEEKRT